MNKGLLAVLAMAALSAVKGKTGSFGKKRNKSVERFDRDIQNILTNLGAKKEGLSLFDAYKKAQNDMDYAEFCPDCPQAYAYASLMLSILINIDGYEVPSEYLVDEKVGKYATDEGIILTGEDIQEVFAFESTEKGKRFSDSLMWKIEEWFIKIQSDLNMIAKDRPDLASEIKDSSVQSLIDETMNAYAMLGDSSLKPNYAGPGILSMGITGYFLVQYIKMYIAIPGDKNILPVLKSIIESYASRGRLVSGRYLSIFSYIEKEDGGELPNLFTNNFFMSIWIPKVDKVIAEKNQILSVSEVRSRDHQKAKRELERLTRSKERAIKTLGRYVVPLTDRDRFISEFFSKNKRTSQGIIQASASKILESLYLLSNGKSLDFSNLKAYSREAYKRLFQIESKVSDEIYVISNLNPDTPSDEEDIPLQNKLLSIFEKTNQYRQTVVNTQLVFPFAAFSNQQASLYSQRHSPSKMSVINELVGVKSLATNFVLYENLSFYNDTTYNLDIEVVPPDPSVKMNKFFNYDLNPTLDRIMDYRNELYYMREMGITRQQFENPDVRDDFEVWEETNWQTRGPDLEPIDYQTLTVTHDDLTENVLLFLFFNRDHRQFEINSLARYLLLVSKFQINIKEKMGGGLEDGMIKYFSERVSILNNMFERALAEVQRYQQAAAQQAARILAAAQQQRLLNDARNQQLRLANQEKRRLQALEYSLDYSTLPLSMTSMSDYIVVKELDNSVMLQTYLNIDKDSLPEENKSVYDKIRPIRTLLIEYFEPSSLRSVYNTTPGDLCVGKPEMSYMSGLKRGSQRHYGIVVETSEGLHVAYHTHTERGKLTKEKFTNKFNKANYPFTGKVSIRQKQNQDDSKAHRNDEILKQSISIISKKK